jgi:hypothetical protein
MNKFGILRTQLRNGKIQSMVKLNYLHFNLFKSLQQTHIRDIKELGGLRSNGDDLTCHVCSIPQGHHHP